MPYVLPGPSSNHAQAVTPDDATDNIRGATWLYIGSGGVLVIRQNITTFKAGVSPSALATVTLTNVPSGYSIACAASWLGVNATDTTASGIVAFF